MSFEPIRPRIATYGSIAAGIDMASPASILFWSRHWNVTLIQLRIAVSRVGCLPPDVARELGLSVHH
jgi:hypothetical protein